VTNTDFTAQASLRKAVLDTMSAAEGGTLMTWPTATALVDLERGVILIVTELDPSPEDWESVCNLLKLAGYDNGTDGPWRTDPGEPVEAMGLATWNLSVGVPVS
jgi:hypothetical protein